MVGTQMDDGSIVGSIGGATPTKSPRRIFFRCTPSKKQPKRRGSFWGIRRSPSGSALGTEQDDAASSDLSDDVESEQISMYQAELEDLREQLRKSQESLTIEQEKDGEIRKLKKQLAEARGGTGADRPSAAPQAPDKSSEERAVASAVEYLDEVIKRVSNSGTKRSVVEEALRWEKASSGGTRGGSNEAVPAGTRRERVEVILPWKSDRGGAESGASDEGSSPNLALSSGAQSSEDDSDGNSSWNPTGRIRSILASDASTAGFESAVSGLHTAASGFHTAASAGGNTAASGFHTAASAGGKTAASAGFHTAASAGGDTLHAARQSDDISVVSTGSAWMPAGAAAALLAEDDSTLHTAANETWITADDDDFNDMQSCVSALTFSTLRSRASSLPKGRGGAVSTASASASASAGPKDDASVVVAELLRIQNLLASVLHEDEHPSDDLDADRQKKPSIESISNRAKIIASLWEEHLNETSSVDRSDESYSKDIAEACILNLAFEILPSVPENRAEF